MGITVFGWQYILDSLSVDKVRGIISYNPPNTELQTNDDKAIIFVTITGVPLIGQTNEESCWAAATAMMLSWKNDKVMSVNEALRETSYRQWYEYLNQNAPAFKDYYSFYTDNVGLTGSKTSYSIQGIKELLETKGPLLVAFNPDPEKDTESLHAVVVTGIYGDGSFDNTFVVYNDPWDYNENWYIPWADKDVRIQKERFSEFNVKYQSAVNKFDKEDKPDIFLYYFNEK
jgi:uncharacterized protein YvpB